MTRPVLPAPPVGYDVQNERETRRVLADAVEQIDARAAALAKRRGSEALVAPTAGSWRQGDIVWNAAPSAGGFIGWVCVAAGTPGTWKTFGAITP